MLQITKQGNSIVVEGLNHYFYPYNGTLEVPCNSVITVVDEGDIVLFRSASNYDVLFSAKVDEITINGQSVTKDNVGEVFGALSNTSSGGGLTPEQEEKLNNAVQISVYNADKAAQTTIDEAQNTEINKIKGDIAGKQDIIQDLNAIREGANLGKTAIQEETDPVWTAEKVNYYTKTESDSIYATQVVVNEEIAARISDIREVKATLESKADKSEIPSLNGYATEQWVGEQGYLTEHQTLKTINGQTIVGDGNITISGGEQISDVLILPQNVEFTYKDGNKYEVVIKDISYNSEGGLDYIILIKENGVVSTKTRKFGYMVKSSSSWVTYSFNSSAYGYKISNYSIPDYVYIFSDDDNPTDENKMYFDLDIPLISGTTIKTINGESIIGSGDIVISGGGEETDPVWTAEKVNYYTKTEVNSSLETKANKSEIPTVPTNVSAFTNDAGYLTEHQQLKTINGETIVGNGNIEISSGEETDPVWTAEKVNYYTKTEVNSSLESKADKTEIPSLNNYYTKSEIDGIVGNVNNALGEIING